MAEEKKIAVKFLKRWNLYNKGEIAGFDAKVSHVLCGRGDAIYNNPDDAPEGWKPPSNGDQEQDADTGDAAGDNTKDEEGAGTDAIKNLLSLNLNDLEKVIKEKDESDEFKISDDQLSEVADAEREGKARPNFLKLLENEFIDRLDSTGG